VPCSRRRRRKRTRQGQFVLTDDFQSADTVRYYRRLLGRPDGIRCRFTGRTVVLKRVTDNTVDAGVTETGAAG
jgi:hypothetical protein